MLLLLLLLLIELYEKKPFLIIIINFPKFIYYFSFYKYNYKSRQTIPIKVYFNEKK